MRAVGERLREMLYRIERESERNLSTRWLPHSHREVRVQSEKFLNCTYFGPCEKHQFHKNEKNHFCIDCMDGPLCSHRLISSHGKHRTLQVRRASHADGVRVDNLSKLLDISGIQTYIINNNRIVYPSHGHTFASLILPKLLEISMSVMIFLYL
ncbi:hypothetical protein KP509_23G043100 [Ceratopteris richardii]|uniref:Uncharacterized protein n=1 Tax=Ceratopteris richardii TaxID=49495 RepID=A0A8T2S253_CERRI|nr:hypothetical protein KP509_23G043100 [Ceratopteris richardii]